VPIVQQKDMPSSSTCFSKIGASYGMYKSVVPLVKMSNDTLVKNPPFATMSPTTFQFKNIVKKRTNVIAKYFLQLGNVFFNYKPKKLICTSRKLHYNWKGQPYANTPTIAIAYHFSCKPHTTIVDNYFQLFFINGWTSFANWEWCHLKF
jgi:hypothetical protein